MDRPEEREITMIHLIDEFYLDADPYQFILIEWDGKTVYHKTHKKNVMQNPHSRYYRTLKSLLEQLALMLERKAVYGSTGLEEIAEKCEDIGQLIKNLGNTLTNDYALVKEAVAEDCGEDSCEEM